MAIRSSFTELLLYGGGSSEPLPRRGFFDSDYVWSDNKAAWIGILLCVVLLRLWDHADRDRRLKELEDARQRTQGNERGLEDD